MASRPLASAPAPPTAHSPFASVIAPLALIAAWQIACSTGLAPEQVLVPPSEVARSLWLMAGSGELGGHVGDSLSRLAVGFTIGALSGLVFGAAIALSRFAEAVLSPLFLTMWQVPVIAFIPTMVIFLGINEPFKIAIVAIAAFFPIALSTFDAVRGVPSAWFEVAKVYRTRLPDLVWRILVPATIPGVLTGLRIALTRAWIVLVAAEILAADSGIGQMMEMGRQLFQLDVVLSGVIVSGVIGFGLDRGARAIEHRATKWKTA